MLEKITQEQWSPEQIVGEARLRGELMVCVERIYQFIRADRKKVGDLWKYCRHKLKHRKRPVTASIALIPNRLSIKERPENVNKREEFGHWEMDLIEGKNHKNFILTLTERKIRFLMMAKLKMGKDSDGVAQTVKRLLLPYRHITHSITTDNGKEFSKHEDIAKFLNIKIYFAYPYCSWQKGTVENTNKLIRQYLPKGTDFDDVTDKQLLNYQYILNRRPRKIINFCSPVNLFKKKL